MMIKYSVTLPREEITPCLEVGRTKLQSQDFRIVFSMWKASFILYVCCLYGFLPGLCGAVNKVGVNKNGDSPVASPWVLVDETLQSYAQKHTFPGQFWRMEAF